MINRILLLIILLMVGGVLSFFIFNYDFVHRALQRGAGVPTGLIFGDELPSKVESWTGKDGATMKAVLVSADDQSVELRLPDTQRVHYLSLEALSQSDQEKVNKRVLSKGKNGVLGFPVSLRADRWPDRWRMEGGAELMWHGEKEVWRSENFDFHNIAKVNHETLETLADICESVDGALKSLPLPLDWGRPVDARRDIVWRVFLREKRRGNWRGFSIRGPARCISIPVNCLKITIRSLFSNSINLKCVRNTMPLCMR